MVINTLDAIERAIWKVSKNLLRDFDELSGTKFLKGSTLRFVSSAERRSKEIIKDEIEKIPAHNFIEKFEDIHDKPDGNYVTYSGLKDSENFGRSLEYFGYYLMSYKKIGDDIKTDLVIISFPVRNSIFFASEGKGSWVQKINFQNNVFRSRMRVSNIREVDETLVNYKLHKNYPRFTNFRHFGSDLYDLKLLLLGKFDAILIEANHHLTEAIQLLATEAGAICKKIDDKILITNSDLVSLFK